MRRGRGLVEEVPNSLTLALADLFEETDLAVDRRLSFPLEAGA